MSAIAVEKGICSHDALTCEPFKERFCAHKQVDLVEAEAISSRLGLEAGPWTA